MTLGLRAEIVDAGRGGRMLGPAPGIGPLDAETYAALAESLEGFLAKLHGAAQSLGVADRQRVLRLVVKEVQVGPDTLVIKRSIPLPDHARALVISCVHGVTIAEIRTHSNGG